MGENVSMITVQVCYAVPAQPFLRELQIAAGATLRQAIEQSGVLERFAEIDLAQCRVGTWGKIKPVETPACDRDRIEIYRPLIADPKESRRQRAEKKAALKGSKGGSAG